MRVDDSIALLNWGMTLCDRYLELPAKSGEEGPAVKKEKYEELRAKTWRRRRGPPFGRR